ncbi:DUF1778 domain-containing protein [Alcanivorax sp. NBRC 102024]|jgi:hypothetical protein|uniref:type II toxin -antitoxin system TacA 1-like antitoxin n=1 Tax=unclassified Alcanivorax TaxID=2638842 RepID=UPI000789F055|nr:DUF1778 domain-containing protein [Alcanivorax sp. NBRC 102024]
MRLSIELTPEQHQLLKVSATLEGKSLKAYVLERVLGNASEQEQSLAALEAFLKTRLQSGRAGSRASSNVDELVNQVLKEEETR